MLELVEGDTLAERIATGPIPISEALTIARQIADALEAAHEKGIVHRDLKPANIKITPDGVVKVLDFGLAKAASGDASGPDLTQSPTVTIGGTRDGVILGTAAYMSPEQARGKPVDKRTDIWAFGCVLYEMLTGRAGVRRRHDLGHHRRNSRARSGLAGAAGGDAARRHAVAAAMPRQGSEAPAARHRRRADRDRGRHQWCVSDTCGDGGCRSTACPSAMGDRGRHVGRGAHRRRRPDVVRADGAADTDRAAAHLAHDDRIVGHGGGHSQRHRSLAITPDGTRVIYVGNNGNQLFVRPLDRLDPMPLVTGTVPLNWVFVSPDGQWVGFDEGGTLKKVALTGGPAETIAQYRPWGFERSDLGAG